MSKVQNTDPHLDGLTRPSSSQAQTVWMLWASDFCCWKLPARMGCLYTRLHAQEGRGRPVSPPRGRARVPDRGKHGWGAEMGNTTGGGERGACFFCWKGLEYKINCL